MWKRIKELREDKDIKQIEIAKYLKMSQNGYSQYETGKNEIPPKIIKELAKFYNTSTDYILELTDEIKPYPRRKEK